jgi:predicted DCC family thiol-disulfide oxidoreductase YuxK
MSETSPRPLDPPAPPFPRSGRSFGQEWSGGQWSFVRVLFALFLAGHFALASDLNSLKGGLVAVGVVASLCLAFGAKTRVMAVVLLGVGGTLLFREPVAPRPAEYGFLLPLIALLCAPPAPFGSVTARNRVDPDGGWRLQSQLFTLLWLGVAALTLWSGIHKLQSAGWREGAAVTNAINAGDSVLGVVRTALHEAPPWLRQSFSWFLLGAELLFAPLALLRATRPFAWLALLLRHVVALPLAGLRDEHLGMAAALLFLFDPAWLPPWKATKREVIYFDGTCGLCHRLVRFVLAEDRAGIFCFSPLQGTAIRGVLSEHARAGLPDSVLVHEASGAMLVKSTAVAHVYERLGGIWRICASLIRLVPRPLRDVGYDVVAKLRRRLFKRPDDSCPVMPAALKARFVP